jgi:hypothetical protein
MYMESDDFDYSSFAELREGMAVVEGGAGRPA